MPIGVRRIDSVVPTSPGQRGIDLVRLTGDGVATSVLVTLGTESDIKTIRGAVCPSRITHNIPVAGVLASTGFTLTLAAATDLGNALTMDVLIIGDGR